MSVSIVPATTAATDNGSVHPFLDAAGLGAGQGAALCLSDPEVSRLHALGLGDAGEIVLVLLSPAQLMCWAAIRVVVFAAEPERSDVLDRPGFAYAVDPGLA